VGKTWSRHRRCHNPFPHPARPPVPAWADEHQTADAPTPVLQQETQVRRTFPCPPPCPPPTCALVTPRQRVAATPRVLISPQRHQPPRRFQKRKFATHRVPSIPNPHQKSFSGYQRNHAPSSSKERKKLLRRDRNKLAHERKRTASRSSTRHCSYPLRLTRKRMAVTSWKQWIHFRRSDFWPPTC
jgi:hypothetical protein